MEKVYRSFYTKSNSIVKYMIDLLYLKGGMRVFEPCAGDGVFIDALNGLSSNLSIDIYELNPKAVTDLKSKYFDYENINITEGNVLTDEDLILLSNAGGIYDRIIANPPYGGWLEYDQRKLLKRIFPNLYVKETYALFLYRCIELLRDKGKLVFIIPDTYLFLHMHKNLRKFLLTNTKINEISVFPSSFFPNISFGYSKLSIIALEKCYNKKECLENDFKVIIGFKDVNELGSDRQHLNVLSFNQKEILDNVDHTLFISDNCKVTGLINKTQKSIKDIADYVTGFYSGNDKKYLKVKSKEIKNGKKYEVVDFNKIYSQNFPTPLYGLSGDNTFIPIVKGGNIKYFKPNNWYMDWSIPAVKDYKTNKKARFQNSQYYFKFGIGVPMVTSSCITAALIENKLFDQSIVGIFPHNKKYVYYLLAFFNSPTCNTLISTINPSANNPANYLKKIPFIEPKEDDLKSINDLVLEIVEELKLTSKIDNIKEQKIFKIIKDIYGF